PAGDRDAAGRDNADDRLPDRVLDHVARRHLGGRFDAARPDVARARKCGQQYSRSVTPTLQADPECARPATAAGESAPAEPSVAPAQPDRKLRAELRPFDSIDRETWDRLAFLNPYSTPFSTWAFQRAWWDAYGENAHPETLVLVDPTAPSSGEPVAIAPLMHRHVVEPSDAQTHTTIRHADDLPLTTVSPDACAVYFGASYH